MKTLSFKLLCTLAFCFLLTACATVSYIGETYPFKNDVKVYYAARDVQQEYKVIGHLAFAFNNARDYEKNEIINKAKTVGADGVIFTGFTANNAITADAIKFTADNKKGENN